MTGLNDFSQLWKRIRDFWDKPRLNPPKFLDEEEAKTKGMQDEIAAIRMDNNEILVNTKNLEERAGKEHTPRIVSHEVGHYKYCPYNLKNFVRLVGHADLATKNLSRAKLIANLYMDLMVNTKEYEKGDHRMVDLYRNLSRGNEDSEVWQLYISTYENMISCQGEIIPEPKEEIKIKSKKLSDIVKEAMGQSNKWPDSVKKFADVVKDYLKKEENQRKEMQNQQKQSDQNPDDGGSGLSQPQQKKDYSDSKQQSKDSKKKQTNQKIPDIRKGLISEHKAQDFIPYDKKKAPKEIVDKYVEKELKGLSEDLGQDEFKRVVRGLGLGSTKQANVWLYNEFATSYTIFLPQISSNRAGEYKESLKKWNIEEGAEKLDYNYSFRQSPILIPNVTTYKWNHKDGENFEKSQGKPDLLIVLDSSTSMPDPNEKLSFPVISSMVAAHSALSYGNKVSVINFSINYKYCNFTNKTKEIDSLLVHYFKEGTEIPGDVMARITSNHNYPIHTMIISDTEIQNLNDETYNLEKVLKNSKAGGSILLACNPSDYTKQLEEIGYKVYFARDFDELGNLAIERSRELYAI